jgi:proteasome lid subunit RPN8/RPN11
MGMEIELTRSVLEQIFAEAARARPQEACGILLGRHRRIEAAKPAQNVHPTPNTHFEIDPQALVDAHRAAREDGPEVLGYYHSHPSGPAEPSATDRALANSDGRVWAIAGIGGVTFWRDDEGGFTALSYAVMER